ncbi:MAG: histidine kinase dimerization/phospho-acceptor domain-containing protein, partial [Pseudomonadota bacterium]
MTPAPHSPAELSALDLLASAVLLLDVDGHITFANAAAENMLECSARALQRQHLDTLFLNADELGHLFNQAITHKYADLRQDLALLRSGREPLHVHLIVSDAGDNGVVLELRENVQQLKLDREERMLDQTLVNKELVRNLAHEIKNPLGGIRGAAQLLEKELPPLHLTELREYTQVIIKEADRLQT